MSELNPIRTPAYREYTALLRQLHAFFLDGRDESAEADEVRDAMDGPGDRLDENESELVSTLSADLYTIGDHAGLAPPSVDPDAAQQAVSLLANSRWIEVLDWARSSSCTLAPAEAANLRAKLWGMHLGDPDSAILFAEEAVRLAPDDWKCTLIRARILIASGFPVRSARSIVEYASRHPGQVGIDILESSRTCVTLYSRYVESRKAFRAADAAWKAVTETNRGAEGAREAEKLAADREQVRRLLNKTLAELRGSRAALETSVPADAA